MFLIFPVRESEHNRGKWFRMRLWLTLTSNVSSVCRSTTRPVWLRPLTFTLWVFLCQREREREICFVWQIGQRGGGGGVFVRNNLWQRLYAVIGNGRVQFLSQALVLFNTFCSTEGSDAETSCCYFLFMKYTRQIITVSNPSPLLKGTFVPFPVNRRVKTFWYCSK